LEPDRCDDPHVERLLESFAFMAARVHLRVDDDFPEVTSALLGIVAPHYLRPIPSMTVVECQVDPEQGKQTAGETMPAGTTIATRRLVERLADPVRVPGAAGVLRVRLQCGRDVRFDQLNPHRLVFHLTGESNVV